MSHLPRIGSYAAIRLGDPRTRHREVTHAYAMQAVESWSAIALRSCLDHLRVSRVTEGQGVLVETAWLDGPEAFCVVYRHPFDQARRVGIRRHRSDAAAADDRRWEPGDLTDAYDMGDPARPDPVAFGMNVADFDIGEPLGRLVNTLRGDGTGVGWWGTLGERLPDQ